MYDFLKIHAEFPGEQHDLFRIQGFLRKQKDFCRNTTRFLDYDQYLEQRDVQTYVQVVKRTRILCVLLRMAHERFPTDRINMRMAKTFRSNRNLRINESKSFSKKTFVGSNESIPVNSFKLLPLVSSYDVCTSQRPSQAGSLTLYDQCRMAEHIECLKHMI